MTNLIRKGLRGLIRTTSVADNPPSGQRALIPKTDGWYDRDSSGAEAKLGGGPLLALVAYNPASLTTYTSAVATFADLDTANLAATFTASSGRVLVRLTAATLASSTTSVWVNWNLRDAGGDMAGTAASAAGSTFRTRPSVALLVTGLTAGNSYTWKWGFAATSSTTVVTYAGGNAGPAVMEVWSA